MVDIYKLVMINLLKYNKIELDIILFNLEFIVDFRAL